MYQNFPEGDSQSVGANSVTVVAAFAFAIAAVSALVGACELPEPNKPSNRETVVYILSMSVSALLRIGLLLSRFLSSQSDNVGSSSCSSTCLAVFRFIVNGFMLFDAIVESGYGRFQYALFTSSMALGCVANLCTLLEHRATQNTEVEPDEPQSAGTICRRACRFLEVVQHLYYVASTVLNVCYFMSHEQMSGWLQFFVGRLWNIVDGLDAVAALAYPYDLASTRGFVCNRESTGDNCPKEPLVAPGPYAA